MFYCLSTLKQGVFWHAIAPTAELLRAQYAATCASTSSTQLGYPAPRTGRLPGQPIADEYVDILKELPMAQSLKLTETTSINDIAKFFADAGSDARILARQTANGGGVELYVRDLSLKGRLQEWRNTTADERKQSYASAKQSIDSIIGKDNLKNVSVRSQSVYEAHKQDFVATEMLNLQEQINAKKELDAVVTNFEVPKSIDHPLKEESSQSKPEAFQVMAQALGQAKPDKLAAALSNLSNGKLSERELRQNFSDFLKVVKLNFGGNKQKNEMEAINFVSAKKFLIALKDIAQSCYALAPGSRTADVSFFFAMTFHLLMHTLGIC
jgi:hypothetical protein